MILFKLNHYVYWFFVLFCFFLLFLIEDYCLFLEWELFMLNSFGVFYMLYFYWISLMFCSVVLFFPSMVVLYSSDYMGVNSYSMNRFRFLVILFIDSMILMIMSPNLLSTLLGWDGLGMVSYCLVIPQWDPGWFMLVQVTKAMAYTWMQQIYTVTSWG